MRCDCRRVRTVHTLMVRHKWFLTMRRVLCFCHFHKPIEWQLWTWTCSNCYNRKNSYYQDFIVIWGNFPATIYLMYSGGHMHFAFTNTERMCELLTSCGDSMNPFMWDCHKTLTLSIRVTRLVRIKTRMPFVGVTNVYTKNCADRRFFSNESATGLGKRI